MSDDNKYVLVQFNKNILNTSVSAADATGLHVVNSDGVDVTSSVFGTAGFTAATNAKSDGTSETGTDSQYIKFYNASGLTLQKGTYTVSVPASAFTDTTLAGNQNAAFTFTFTVNDLNNTTPIAVGTATTPTINGDGTESFALPLGTAANSSALSTANYSIDGKALPAGTLVEFTNTNKDTVRITVPANSFTADANVTLAVFNLQNSAGKVQSGTALQTIAVKGNTAPTVVSAVANADGTMTLNFNEAVQLGTGTATGVKLYKADGTLDVASTNVSVVGKTATVTIALSGVNLSSDTLSVIAGAFKDQTSAQNPNAAISGIQVGAGYVEAPGATAAQTSNSKNASDIKLTISNLAALKAEGVTSFDVYLYGATGVVTKTTAPGFTVAQNIPVSSVAGDGTVRLSSSITRDSKTGNALSFTNGAQYYVTLVAKDAKGDAAYSATEVNPGAMNYTAPTSSVPATTGTTNSGTALAVTFSAPLYVGGTAVADGADVTADFTYTGAGSITSATYVAATNTVKFVITGAANGDKIAAKAGLFTDSVGNAYVPVNYTYASTGTIWS